MKYQLIAVLLLIAIIVTGQESTTLENYPALKIAKETSLFKDDVDWNKIIPNYIKIANQSTVKIKQYEYLTNALGDEHGTFRSSQNFQIIANYTGNSQNHNPHPFDYQFHSNVINNPNATFEYKLIESNIGYLKVVGVGSQRPMETVASEIQEAIAELQEKGVDKWIVDLRYNGGGNMNPMLTGLTALLGEGNIGGSSDRLGNELSNYVIKKGQFIDTESLVIDIDNPVQNPINDKIAILVSRYTISSGEVVAIAFKGKENTRFFGQQSAGMTTVTGYDFIDNETIMLISKAYYRDRNNEVYTNGVDVDEVIEFDEYADFEDDKIIHESVKWLDEKS